MTTQARTVVHVIAPSPVGGAESVVVALASAAKDRTRAVILNQMADEAAPLLPLTEQLRRRGVVAEEVRCGRRRYRAEARVLEGMLRRLNAGVVHTHGYHANWVGHRAARRLGLPVVCTVHGYLLRSLKERLYNWLDRRVLRDFDAVVAVSQGIHDELRASGIRADRLHFVQNGLAPSMTLDRASARNALGIRSDEHAVGWVGRLSAEKGADLFLGALAHCDPSVHGVIVGEGPELQRLQTLAQELGLEGDRIRFAGFRPDAAALLPAFDVLALSSRIEGTPMVILEAVAVGLPIVAFAVGGIPQLLSNDIARLVPAEDVRGFAEGLSSALDRADESRDRALAAQARLADRLSIDRWLERVFAVYGRAGYQSQQVTKHL